MLKKWTVALLKWYRRSLSPKKRRPCCRFYPTCSGYALTAVEERGVLTGGILALRRISRCHPFGGEGIDPVPISHRKCKESMKSSEQLKQGRELLRLCLETHEKES